MCPFGVKGSEYLVQNKSNGRQNNKTLSIFLPSAEELHLPNSSPPVAVPQLAWLMLTPSLRCPLVTAGAGSLWCESVVLPQLQH